MAIGLTKVSGTIESSQSVANNSISWASETGGTILNANVGERYSEIRLNISVTFNASSTGDAELHLRYFSNTDTGTFAKIIKVVSGSTDFDYIIPAGFDYLDVGIKNTDDNYSLTYSCDYEGYKITGMS